MSDTDSVSQDEEPDSELQTKAFAVLHKNDLGGSTKPAPSLYPHQWLWDSCFIAIGLRHVDITRAKTEITSLFRGQWANGMLPHEIFNHDSTYYAGNKMRTDHIKEAPKSVLTSGLTQPPMIAEAVIRIGNKMSGIDRKAFFREVYPYLVGYHQWLYRERDPHRSGLITLLHSHESGLDNVPYWMELTRGAAPIRVRALRSIRQEDILDHLRRDRKIVNTKERLSAAEIYTSYHIIGQLRRMKYDLSKILKPIYSTVPLINNIPLVQDVVFNAILIRANQHLRTIAAQIGTTLPDDLQESIDKGPHAFETLFSDGAYWSRDFRSGNLIKEPTIGTFLALYAGTIPQEHADLLAQQLQKPEFWSTYGIASTPTNSPYFKPRSYWQGPVWVNMNWLIADGLERYGYDALAGRLRLQTLDLVRTHGMFEYFSPIDGKGAGTDNFSWTAALTIDLLSREGQSQKAWASSKAHKKVRQSARLAA